MLYGFSRKDALLLPEPAEVDGEVDAVGLLRPQAAVAVEELRDGVALAELSESRSKFAGKVLLYLDLHLSTKGRCSNQGYHACLNEYNASLVGDSRLTKKYEPTGQGRKVYV